MKKIIRLTAFIFALVIFSSSFLIFANAAAVPAINPMLDTQVCNDLKTLGINPERYAIDTSATHVRDLYFLEYGYNKGTDQRYYGLYLYLLNPCGKKIETAYVEMSYVNKDGSSSSVVKYPVDILSYSIDDNDMYLFYKLKIGGTSSIVGKINEVRTYNLNSIELIYVDESDPVSYKLGSTWKYTGFQENCGSANPGGTLYCESVNRDVVDVELQSASWLSDTAADLGDDYRWEIKSYYFAIPNDIIADYGNISDNKQFGTTKTSGLVGVTGQYYKYGLNGLIVPDKETYDLFYPTSNVQLNGITLRDRPSFAVNYYFSGNSIYYPPNTRYEYPYAVYGSDVSFNRKSLYSNGIPESVYNSSFTLQKYLLLSQSSENGFSISNDELTSLWTSAGKPIIYGSSMLHSESYMSNIGKQVPINIDVKTAGSLTDGLKVYSGRAEYAQMNFLEKLFNQKLKDEVSTLPECKPLVEITLEDVNDVQIEDYLGTDLFVDYESFLKLQAYYKKNNSGNHIYLMRLDVDPMYCAEASLFSNPTDSDALGTGYYYEKTIHKDVDIFQFTFENKDGRRTIVPVNCTPLTNVGSVAPGNDYDDPNPNRYPDDPSAAELLAGLIKDLFDWLDTIKGIAILVGTITIVIVLFILMIVFWKQVGPALQKSGKVVGKVGRGIGGFFKFIFEFIGDCCLLIHNIGANVLFFFFKIDLRVPKRLDFGFNSKTEPIDRDAREDRKWELEERVRKRKNEEEDRAHKANKDAYMREVYEEERRQRREAHEKNMKSGGSGSSKPNYSTEKETLKKALAKDRAAQDKRLGRSPSYGDSEEFFNAAVARGFEDLDN